jgi:hypothetical protein
VPDYPYFWIIRYQIKGIILYYYYVGCVSDKSPDRSLVLSNGFMKISEETCLKRLKTFSKPICQHSSLTPPPFSTNYIYVVCMYLYTHTHILKWNVCTHQYAIFCAVTFSYTNATNDTYGVSFWSQNGKKFASGEWVSQTLCIRHRRVLKFHLHLITVNPLSIISEGTVERKKINMRKKTVVGRF